MNFATVCSGIGAVELAFSSVGMTPVFASEIDSYPREVLTYRFPGLRVFGDFTKISGDEADAKVDCVAAGTPCQSFSVAGKKLGMGDPRGQLALEYLRFSTRIGRPRWLLWENVPGVLTSDKGRDFAAFLSAVEQCGYGYAWRVLDAQYFGLAQRRKRVLLVGYLGDWRPPAAVLFEPKGLRGDSAESGKEGDEVPSGHGGSLESRRVCASVTAKWAKCNGGPSGDEAQNLVPETLGSLDTECGGRKLTGQSVKNGHILRVRSGGRFVGVRRLTPLECERLQGFPDNWTAVPWAGKPADRSPATLRYKAIGNSMAVPVIRWIGERLLRVDSIISSA